MLNGTRSEQPICWIKPKKTKNGLSRKKIYPVFYIETEKPEVLKIRDVNEDNIVDILNNKRQDELTLDDDDYDELEKQAEKKEEDSYTIVWFFIGNLRKKTFQWVNSVDVEYFSARRKIVNGV